MSATPAVIGTERLWAVSSEVIDAACAVAAAAVAADKQVEAKRVVTVLRKAVKTRHRMWRQERRSIVVGGTQLHERIERQIAAEERALRVAQAAVNLVMKPSTST